MKRTFFLLGTVAVGLLGLLPPVSAEVDGFHGFGSFQTRAQGQVAEVTGFLNAFREDNRIVGAVTEINGPPANSRNIAAFFQRGEGATFIYGVIGGPGGGRGTLPDPPPGEASAFYPSEPYEMTFQGPVTAGAQGQVLDGRFYAQATETPTGRAEAMVTKVVQEGSFVVEQATVVSHTEPVEGGVASESVSVLHQVAAGPLLIQSLVSRAQAFVPAAGGEPKGIASTVVEGATVNGTPVQITDQGIVVGENANPLEQQQVNKAMADAGFPQVRLLPSTAEPGDDGSSVLADAGAVEFVKQDEAFGASNPQGFSGGGFSLGGATAIVAGVRCAPDCPKESGLEGLPEDPLPEDGSLPVDGSSSYDSTSSDASFTSDSTSTEEFTGGEILTTDTSGSAGYDSGYAGSSSLGDEGPALDYSSSTAVTPPDLTTGPSGSQQAAGSVPVQQQQATLAASAALGPEEATWVRDLYLAIGVMALVLFVGQRLARAF